VTRPKSKTPARSGTSRGDGRGETRPQPVDTSIIRALREAQGLTQTQLAAIVAGDLGVGEAGMRSALARYESGAEVPSPERLEAILSALGADARGRCRADLGRVLTPAALSGWVAAHGPALVTETLRAYADAVEVGAEVGAMIDAAAKKVRRR